MDRGDHLVRRPVADARAGEHQQEDAEEQREDRGVGVDGRGLRGAFGGRDRGQQRQGAEDPEGAEDQSGEGRQRDPGAAEPVGEVAAERAGDGADEGAEEGVVGEVDADPRRHRAGLVPEVELDQQRHRGGVADERAEGADVEERHHPGVPVLQYAELLAGVGARVGQVVHAQQRCEHGDDREAGVHPGRPLQVDPALTRPDQAEDARAADDHRQEQLDDRDAEVAARGVEAERGALEPGGVEEVDVRHRAGEVAAAEAGGRGDHAEHPVRRAGPRDGVREAERRDEQQPGAHDRPVPAAEPADRQRVRHPDQRTDEVRDRHQEEQLLRREGEPLRDQERRAHAPDQPHREPEVLGEDRPDQVAPGDRRAGRLPERRVLGTPVVDPPAPATVRGRFGRAGGEVAATWTGQGHRRLLAGTEVRVVVPQRRRPRFRPGASGGFLSSTPPHGLTRPHGLTGSRGDRRGRHA